MQAHSPTRLEVRADRKCFFCHCDDRQVFDGHDDDNKPVHKHWVSIELRFLEKPEELTSRHLRNGWTYRPYQGRHAMERMICRRCMNERHVAEREFELARQRHLAIEKAQRGQDDNYYADLCQEQ